MRIKVRDLATAGLPAEGVYRLRLESGRVEEGISQSNGNPWERIDINFRAIEDANKNAVNFMIFDKFWVSSSMGLKRFLKLFEAVTGYIPEDGEVVDNEPVVDTRDLLEEILHSEVVAAVTYDTSEVPYRLQTGWNFSQNLTDVKMPKPKPVE